MTKLNALRNNILFKNALLFTVVITIIFFVIRNNFFIYYKGIEKSIPSLASMYSVIGAIYSLITAFVINNQWNNWNNLISGCNQETNGFRQINIFLNHFPKQSAKIIKEKIINYLTLLINEYWNYGEIKTRTEEVEESLIDFEDLIYEVSDQVPKLSFVLLNTINDINKGREKRLHYSSRYLPFMMKTFIAYMTLTMITLSFFIGISNIWLDYIFTMSLTMHFFMIYLIIDDMEHPYRKGTWHVSMKEYRVLLAEMER